MNLRKLLCGLLALCLLLTMAPAALMEEAPVEEQVVELGGEEVASEAVEAEDYKAIGFDDATADLTLPSALKATTGKKGYSGSTWLAVGDLLSLDADDGYEIKENSVKSQNVRVATADDSGIEGVRVGKALVKATVVDKYGKSVSCAITVNVYDPEKVAAVNIYLAGGDDYEDVLINGKTLPSADVLDGSVEVYAEIVPEGLDDVIYWSSSKSGVAYPLNSVTESGEENYIVFKSKGTAKITAKSGEKTATFTVKVTDANAPKSISIKSETNFKVAVGGYLPLYTVIDPRPLADMAVEWSIDSNKYAAIYDPVAETYGKKGVGDTCVIYGGAEGKVKLTAKTYNGKKSTVTIEVVDPNKPTGISMYGFYSKEKFDWELYDEDYTLEYSTPAAPVRNSFLIVPVISNAAGEIPVDEALTQYANVKWKSSNTKVATIEIYKNYAGYAQDQDEEDLEDLFGNNVFDLMEGYIDYAAIVHPKATGTTTLTATTKDGKHSFSVTLKVVNNLGADSIELPFGSTVELGVGDIVDLTEYVEVIPYDAFGKLTVEPTHSTSKLVKVDSGLYRADKKGTVTIKAKFGDLSKTFKIKIK